VDLPLLIRHRLKELGIEQRDLAAAAQVTESYISQLLTGKKAPPIPERTDIYSKMERFLKLPGGKLAKLADLQRKEALKKTLVEPPRSLYQEVRELVLLICEPRNGDATAEEIDFLSQLKFTRKRPTPLYNYWELHIRRDPPHFRVSSTEKKQP